MTNEDQDKLTKVYAIGQVGILYSSASKEKNAWVNYNRKIFKVEVTIRSGLINNVTVESLRTFQQNVGNTAYLHTIPSTQNKITITNTNNRLCF
jgi:hypothetical protein